MNYEIKDTIYDFYGDDCFGVVGTILDGKIIGKIDFRLTEKDKEFYIMMIEVDNGYKRQGIATAMLNYVKDKYADYYVEWGYTTDDGTYLKNKLTKTIINSEYVNIEEEIKKINSEMDKIEQKMDYLYNNTEYSDEQLQEIITDLGDKWEELDNRQRYLIELLQDMKKEITVWR